MPEPLPLRPSLTPEAVAPYRSHQIHPGVFTRRQCERIIAAAEELQREVADLEGGTDDEVDESIRSSSVSWIAPGPDTDWIFSKLATVARRANRHYGFDLSGFDEDLQFTRYERPGAFYTWHQDGLDVGVHHRKLALVVQLTDPDDYDGADLELFDVVEDSSPQELAEFRRIVRRRGTVVVFPTFEYHRVTPLRSGGRQSLVAWIGGPPFR